MFKMSLYTRTVFVSGLPSSIQGADLRDVFDSIAGLEALFILKDPKTFCPTGEAFVIFKDDASVSEAVTQKHGTTPHADHVLEVKPATVEQESMLQGLHRLDSTAAAAPGDVASIVDQLKHLDPFLLKDILQKLSEGQSPPKLHAPSTPDDLNYSIRIPQFSGDGGKGEVTYPQWKYEVRCLRNAGKHSSVIQQAIRRSVRGTAADVLRCLGDASLDRILQKFDTTFGDILAPEQLLQLFFSAQQTADQNATAWASVWRRS